MREKRVAVLGAGSWGTALAVHAARKGHATTLWARRAELAEQIQRERVNSTYLPGFALPSNLLVTGDLRLTLEDAHLIIVAIPTPGLRSTLRVARDLIPKDAPLLSATKGIELETLQVVSEIFADVLPNCAARFACIGGPSFAKEMMIGLPTTVCVAAKNEDIISLVQDVMCNDSLRVYGTDDVIGVEVGGALKNVIAIATGIVDGLQLGQNARAGIITRGLAEISRLAVAKGAHPLTLAGLSGVGDLVLTCTGDLSRNRQVGLKLGQGKKLVEILAEMSMVAEGVLTTKSAKQLATREGIEMPITEQVYAVLYEDRTPVDAFTALMRRPQRNERD